MSVQILIETKFVKSIFGDQFVYSAWWPIEDVIRMFFFLFCIVLFCFCFVLFFSLRYRAINEKFVAQ